MTTEPVEVLAIDPATKTGVAYGPVGGAPRLWTESFGGDGSDWVGVYGRATFWLADFLRTHKPAVIVIEGVVPPSAAQGFTNHDTTMITIGLFGIFTGLAGCKGIDLKVARIATWRKHFLGKGNLKTQEAKQAALRRCRLLKWEAPDHNAAEAGGIWDWGCGQLRAPTFGDMKW